MADRRARRRTAPKRALIGPVVMLLGGVAAGVVLWRVLLLEPAPRGGQGAAAEQLTRHDQEALDRLLEQH